MNKLAGVVLVALLINGADVLRPGLAAQQGAVAGEQQPAPEIQAGAPDSVLLKEGTEVKLELAQTVTGKAAVVGEPIELALAEDLRVGDVMVLRKGARVLGRIVEGRKSEKQRGRIKSLRIRVDFIKAGDHRIMLRGEKAGVGKRNKKGMVAGTAAFGLTGLLLTMGKKYQIPVGTPVTAYVDEDVNLPTLE